MSNLMSFLLNTLEGPLNDPGNARFWLPKQLQGMKNGSGHPILPIKSDHQDIGALTGSSGDYIATQIAQNWYVYNSDKGPAIPTPGNADPILKLNDLVIDGLDNAYVVSNTATPTAKGYSVELVIQFGHYVGKLGQPGLTQLSLSTGFNLTQSICTSSDNTP